MMHISSLLFSTLLISLSGVSANHIYAPLTALNYHLDLLLPLDDQPVLDRYHITTIKTPSLDHPPPSPTQPKYIWKRDQVCPVGYTWVPANQLTQSNGHQDNPQTSDDSASLPFSMVIFAGTTTAQGEPMTTTIGGSVITFIPVPVPTNSDPAGSNDPGVSILGNPTAGSSAPPTAGVFQPSPTPNPNANSVPTNGAFTATQIPGLGESTFIPDPHSIVTSGGRFVYFTELGHNDASGSTDQADTPPTSMVAGLPVAQTATGNSVPTVGAFTFTSIPMGDGQPSNNPTTQHPIVPVVNTPTSIVVKPTPTPDPVDIPTLGAFTFTSIPMGGQASNTNPTVVVPPVDLPTSIVVKTSQTPNPVVIPTVGAFTFTSIPMGGQAPNTNPPALANAASLPTSIVVEATIESNPVEVPTVGEFSFTMTPTGPQASDTHPPMVVPPVDLATSIIVAPTSPSKPVDIPTIGVFPPDSKTDGGQTSGTGGPAAVVPGVNIPTSIVVKPKPKDTSTPDPVDLGTPTSGVFETFNVPGPPISENPQQPPTPSTQVIPTQGEFQHTVPGILPTTDIPTSVVVQPKPTPSTTPDDQTPTVLVVSNTVAPTSNDPPATHPPPTQAVPSVSHDSVDTPPPSAHTDPNPPAQSTDAAPPITQHESPASVPQPTQATQAPPTHSAQKLMERDVVEMLGVCMPILEFLPEPSNNPPVISAPPIITASSTTVEMAIVTSISGTLRTTRITTVIPAADLTTSQMTLVTAISGSLRTVVISTVVPDIHLLSALAESRTSVTSAARLILDVPTSAGKVVSQSGGRRVKVDMILAGSGIVFCIGFMALLG